MKCILVIRFSSLGDVLLSLPVLNNVVKNNPEVTLYVLTKPAFASVFSLLPRTIIIPFDVKKNYKGLFGLLRLFQDLRKNYAFDGVADLHASLRTKILRCFFFFTQTPFYAINKNRFLKKTYLKKRGNSLPLVTQIYSKVFEWHGLKISPDWSFNFSVLPSPALEKWLLKYALEKFNCTAIAPFAAYEEKMYPIEKTTQIIRVLAKEKNNLILLLGNGEREIKILKALENLATNIISLHEFSLLDQLYVLQFCAAAVVMDSANMHLAGLAQIKNIVSVWGATSPKSGFQIWKNNHTISSHIACQPCSIFGNKPCKRGDYLCLQSIATTTIIKALEKRT